VVLLLLRLPNYLGNRWHLVDLVHLLLLCLQVLLVLLVVLMHQWLLEYQFLLLLQLLLVFLEVPLVLHLRLLLPLLVLLEVHPHLVHRLLQLHLCVPSYHHDPGLREFLGHQLVQLHLRLLVLLVVLLFLVLRCYHLGHPILGFL